MNHKNQINIIMFNMSRYADWQKGIVNRNFHVLHNLVKNNNINKVIAVDFLPFNWKRGVKNYINDQIIKDTRGEIVYGDLTSRCWQVSSKILVYSTIDNLLNKDKITSELKKIIKKENMSDNLIVWNYNPLYTDYFPNELGQTLNIFDAVDDWLTHSSYEKYKPILEKNYIKIRENSNLIFTVSKHLQETLFEEQSNAHWLPNAVDLEYFQSQTDIYDKLKDIKLPIIGFLGILQDRINIDILEYLATQNPDKSLVLAGPVWDNFPKDKLNKFKNVHFLGPINYKDIPKLYNGFTVGIIPYKTNDFVKSTDPMKFYEYLAAKLAIVSTPIAGLDRFKNLIEVAKTPEEFDEAVNQAISEDKSFLNQEKENLLQTNTWQKRIKQMLELINNKLV